MLNKTDIFSFWPTYKYNEINNRKYWWEFAEMYMSSQSVFEISFFKNVEKITSIVFDNSEECLTVLLVICLIAAFMVILATKIVR